MTIFPFPFTIFPFSSTNFFLSSFYNSSSITIIFPSATSIGLWPFTLFYPVHVHLVSLAVVFFQRSSPRPLSDLVHVSGATACMCEHGLSDQILLNQFMSITQVQFVIRKSILIADRMFLCGASTNQVRGNSDDNYLFTYRVAFVHIKRSTGAEMHITQQGLSPKVRLRLLHFICVILIWNVSPTFWTTYWSLETVVVQRSAIWVSLNRGQWAFSFSDALVMSPP